VSEFLLNAGAELTLRMKNQMKPKIPFCRMPPAACFGWQPFASAEAGEDSRFDERRIQQS
jgi:hypothetical protein